MPCSQGFKGQLMPWDWCYYNEKYKDEKYALNDEVVKPYLKLENVKKGVFMLANKLYGLNFTPDDKIEVYHPEVTAYDVTDETDVSWPYSTSTSSPANRSVPVRG